MALQRLGSQQQLASLAGKLSFVSTVVPHGHGRVVVLRSLFAAASAGEQDIALVRTSSGRAARRLKQQKGEGALKRDLASTSATRRLPSIPNLPYLNHVAADEASGDFSVRIVHSKTDVYNSGVDLHVLPRTGDRC
jgi:hypothetical protein